MMHGQILTSRVGSGAKGNVFRPALGDDYALETCHDVTGQQDVPPPVDLYVVEVLCEQSTIDAIAGDGKYSILWAEPEPITGLEG